MGVLCTIVIIDKTEMWVYLLEIEGRRDVCLRNTIINWLSYS